MQKRFQHGQQRVRDDLRSLGCGMNAVGLDGVGDIDQILVDHGHDRAVMFGGQIKVDLVELVDVVGSVVGRQGDAGEKHLDVRVFESGDDRFEVAPRLVERKPAQTVVAAELDDHDRGVELEDWAESDHGVLGGGAAGSAVDHFVWVAEPVEIALERGRVGLAAQKSGAGGDAVTETNHQFPVAREQWRAKEKKEKCGKKRAADVHSSSVDEPGKQQGSGTHAREASA